MNNSGNDENKTIILTDDLGNDVEFEILDLFDFECEEYVVLMPVNAEKNDVIILRIESFDDVTETYTGIDDADLLCEVFELFKERNKDIFTFD